MSHTKSIALINHTIESHETGHMWDHITHMIKKIMASGNLWRYGYQELEVRNPTKMADLPGNFINDTFLMTQSNSGAYEDT